MNLSAYDLKALQRASEGRQRVTKRLTEAVIALSNFITEYSEVNDTVQFKNQILIVREVDTGAVMGKIKVLCIDSDERVLNYTEPWRYNIMDHKTATREQIIFVAEHAKRIVTEFAKLQEKRLQAEEQAESQLLKVVECIKTI